MSELNVSLKYNFLLWKNFGYEIFLAPRRILEQKNSDPKNFWSKKWFCSIKESGSQNNHWSQKILDSPKVFGPKKMLGPKKSLGPKKRLGSKNNFGSGSIFGLKNIGGKNTSWKILARKYFIPKLFGWSEKSKYIGAWIIMGLKNLFFKRNYGSKRICGSEKHLVRKYLSSTIIFGPKYLGPKEHRVQKDIRSKKYLSSKAILSAKKDDKSNLGLKKCRLG